MMQRFAEAPMVMRAWFVLLLLSSQGIALADCICDRDEALAALRDAAVVVEGRVRSAERRADGSIAFTLMTTEAFLRGSASQPLTLTTPAPEACGAKIRLAYGDVYWLRHGQPSITRCQTVTALRDDVSPHVPEILRMVTDPDPALDADRRRRLRRRLKDLDAGELEEFFALVARIDPDNAVTTRPGEAIDYRRIRVTLTSEGTYEGLEVLP